MGRTDSFPFPAGVPGPVPSWDRRRRIGGSVASPACPRVDGFEDICAQAELLRAAIAEIADGDDSFETLDQRDEALRRLCRLGASSAALVTFTGMSPTAIEQVVRGSRPDGRGHRTRVTALLLAELP